MPKSTKKIRIESHKGPYSVFFHTEFNELTNALAKKNVIFLIDERVKQLHSDTISSLFHYGPVISVEALEANKSLDTMPKIIESLIDSGIRRGDTLVVIGGGIVQDIGCFIASTLFRGLSWVFVPTTLLAQADSCIGSKSSINLRGHKNIIGTFNPPEVVHICPAFVSTLSNVDLRSGVGEMLKVHMLDSIKSLSEIITHYDRLLVNKNLTMEFLRASLLIKKRYIEADEFDQGIRNLLNYGHSFGHAIEGATNFKIPHGIAVTMGMDIANFISPKIGFGTNNPFEMSHDTMRKNYHGFQSEPIDINIFRAALEKDKKNTSDQLGLILPNKNDLLEKVLVNKTEKFWNLCIKYFAEMRLS